MSEIDSPYGATYKDASESEYAALCVQPMVILKASQERLRTFLSRANSRWRQSGGLHRRHVRHWA